MNYKLLLFILSTFSLIFLAACDTDSPTEPAKGDSKNMAGMWRTSKITFQSEKDTTVSYNYFFILTLNEDNTFKTDGSGYDSFLYTTNGSWNANSSEITFNYYDMVSKAAYELELKDITDIEGVTYEGDNILYLSYLDTIKGAPTKIIYEMRSKGLKKHDPRLEGKWKMSKLEVEEGGEIVEKSAASESINHTLQFLGPDEYNFIQQWFSNGLTGFYTADEWITYDDNKRIYLYRYMKESRFWKYEFIGEELKVTPFDDYEAQAGHVSYLFEKEG